MKRDVMFMKRSLVFLLGGLALLALPRTAGAAEAAPTAGNRETGPLMLTLEQTLALAAEQSRDVQKAREYRNQVEGRYVEEKSVALPHFTLAGSAVYSGDESQDGLGPPVRTDNYAATLGVVQPIFTWGQIGAALRLADIGRSTAGDRMAGARGRRCGTQRSPFTMCCWRVNSWRSRRRTMTSGRAISTKPGAGSPRAR
jgi:outer membrane protein TolC